ncbi:MAG: patatin-like phospholipase family protein [Rudaea sp.]
MDIEHTCEATVASPPITNPGESRNDTYCSKRRGAATFLRSIAFFSELDAASIVELAAHCDEVELPGGLLLFTEGDSSDALYIVRSGMLGAYTSSATGPTLLGTIGVGEIVGEMGLITQRPRGATVRALRDSVVLRIPQQQFHALVAGHPAAMMKSLSVAITRLQSDGSANRSAPHTFALLPHDDSVDAIALARQFRAALTPHGCCAVIDAATGSGRDCEWFAALEDDYRFVIYVADGNDADWRLFCARQADAFILPVRARQTPTPWPEGCILSTDTAPSRPRHLVLLHDGDVSAGSASDWLAHVGGARHHHVRTPADIARIARLMIGRGIGLVLSGGGARGFAHLGVARALREAGKPIDYVGGTSIGAIVGAVIAADWSYQEAMEKLRRTFVDGKPLKDYTLPFVSMTRGHRVSRLLQNEFGALDIRDLPISFFAVSTNLTQGSESVCCDGPLWLALRASSAIPGVLPPLLRDGEVFVDGAVLDNFPVVPMRRLGVTDIIGVDIGTENTLRAQIDEHALPSWWCVAYGRMRSPRSRPGLLRILLRPGMLNAEVANATRRAQTSLLLTPPVRDVDLLDWSAFDKAVDAGYRYTCERLCA